MVLASLLRQGCSRVGCCADNEHLQRLLLESIANGTVTTWQTGLPALLDSTLLRHQVRGANCDFFTDSAFSLQDLYQRCLLQPKILTLTLCYMQLGAPEPLLLQGSFQWAKTLSGAF